jgi:glycosyltransferase involved in cell wall biosynthesis
MPDLYFSNAPAPYRTDFYRALEDAGFRLTFYEADLDAVTRIGRKAVLRHPAELVKKERPHRVLVPEYSLISLQMAMIKKRDGFRLISVCDDSIDMIRGNDFSLAHRWARRIVPSFMDEVIVHSRTVKDWYQEHYGKGVLMPVMADERRIRPALERVIPLSVRLRTGDKPVVAFVGRFVGLKNIPALIRAFEPLKDRAQLVLIGDGPEREKLREMAPEALFPGMLSGDDLLAWYNVIDILVLPSTQEAYGAVTGEALMAGARVIVSRRAGSSDLVREGENGYTVDPADIGGLTERIGLLLEGLESGRPLCLRDNLHPCRFESCMNNLLNEINTL